MIHPYKIRMDKIKDIYICGKYIGDGKYESISINQELAKLIDEHLSSDDRSLFKLGQKCIELGREVERDLSPFIPSNPNLAK